MENDYAYHLLSTQSNELLRKWREDSVDIALEGLQFQPKGFTLNSISSQMGLSTSTYLTMVLNDDALIPWNSCSKATNQSFSHSKMNFWNMFNHDYSRIKVMILNKIVFWSNEDIMLYHKAFSAATQKD